MSPRTFLSAITGAAILVSIPGAAIAGPTAEVVSPPSLDIWSQTVFTKLDRQFRSPVDTRFQIMPTGIVAVKFGCSESGAPSAIGLYKSSGDRRLDRATLRAVRHIATLHPLPHGLGHDQQFIVRVLFANTGQGAERLVKQMQREASSSNAWYNKRSTLTASIEVVPLG